MSVTEPPQFDESNQEARYQMVCSLKPGFQCRYKSSSHKFTQKPVTIVEPIEEYEDKTVVPVLGPEQDEAKYYFIADHIERKAYQRHGDSSRNELRKLQF